MKIVKEEDENNTTYGGSTELGEPPAPVLAVIDTRGRSICPSCKSIKCSSMNFIDRIKCLKSSVISEKTDYIEDSIEDWTELHGEVYDRHEETFEIESYSKVKHAVESVIENLSNFLDSLNKSEKEKHTAHKSLTREFYDIKYKCSSEDLERALIEVVNLTTKELQNFIENSSWKLNTPAIVKEANNLVNKMQLSPELTRRGYKKDFDFMREV